MKDFFQLRESVVKTADKKPEKYVDPEGRTKVRMVPTDKNVVKTEQSDLDEISVKDLADKIANSGSKGLKQTMKANKADELRKTLDAMKARLATEQKDPREYDYEGDMVKSQLRQICKANRSLMDMIGDDDNLPEWVQSKVTKATDYMNSVRAYLEAEMDDEEDEDEMEQMMPMRRMHMMRRPMYSESVEEKTLTPAEKKKREEIAKAMERENPGMDMSKKMAIATAQAKKVAEDVEQIEEVELNEKVYASDYNVGHEKSQFGGYRPHVTHKKTGKTMYLGQTSYKKPEHAKGHAAAYLKGYEQMGDRTANRMGSEYEKANKKHVYKESAEEAKPDAVEVMRKKQQMANISTSDKDKLAKIRAMLDKEKKK